MKRILNNFEECILLSDANLHRIIGINEQLGNIVGVCVVQTIVDEGLTTFRVVWSGGYISEQYKTIEELFKQHPSIKFYQI